MTESGCLTVVRMDSQSHGIMEKKMETTIMGFIGYIMGLYWDNGKENGNYYSIGFTV